MKYISFKFYGLYNIEPLKYYISAHHYGFFVPLINVKLRIMNSTQNPTDSDK